MNILLHRNFEKQYKKLDKRKQEKFKERMSVFVKNRQDSILNNHSLFGKFKDYRSINIDGDLRAIFKTLDDDTFLFSSIGSHSDLYG